MHRDNSKAARRDAEPARKLRIKHFSGNTPHRQNRGVKRGQPGVLSNKERNCVERVGVGCEKGDDDAAAETNVEHRERALVAGQEIEFKSKVHRWPN